MAHTDGNTCRAIRRVALAASALTVMLGALNTAAFAQSPPSISCIGGLSTGTTCICRQPSVKVQTGPNSYRCVMGDLTSNPGPDGRFVSRFDNGPRLMVGPAAQGGQPPFAPPTFNRQSAPHGMFR